LIVVGTPNKLGRRTNYGGGRPGLAGIVTVTVLVLVLVVTLVVVVVDSVVAVVVVVVVCAVVAVVAAVVVVVVSVVGDCDAEVVVVVAAVRAVLDIGPTGLEVEFEPPKIEKTITTKRSAPRAPNPTSAQGLRYHGTPGRSGGPGGGSPGGCCPYPPWPVGWSE
jgi:uncharacterized membrane protein YgcG